MSGPVWVQGRVLLRVTQGRWGSSGVARAIRQDGRGYVVTLVHADTQGRHPRLVYRGVRVPVVRGSPSGASFETSLFH